MFTVYFTIAWLLFYISFYIYFTFVLTLVLFLTKHCFLPRNRDVRLLQEPAPARGGPASLCCFLPSILTYQTAEAFACRRNQLLLAKWPKFCESRNRIPNFFIFCVCVAVAACVWVCARKLRKPSKNQENMQIHKKLFGFYSREGV